MTVVDYYYQNRSHILRSSNHNNIKYKILYIMFSNTSQPPQKSLFAFGTNQSQEQPFKFNSNKESTTTQWGMLDNKKPTSDQGQLAKKVNNLARELEETKNQLSVQKQIVKNMDTKMHLLMNTVNLLVEKIKFIESTNPPNISSNGPPMMQMSPNNAYSSYQFPQNNYQFNPQPQYQNMMLQSPTYQSQQQYSTNQPFFSSQMSNQPQIMHPKTERIHSQFQQDSDYQISSSKVSTSKKSNSSQIAANLQRKKLQKKKNKRLVQGDFIITYTEQEDNKASNLKIEKQNCGWIQFTQIVSLADKKFTECVQETDIGLIVVDDEWESLSYQTFIQNFNNYQQQDEDEQTNMPELVKQTAEETGFYVKHIDKKTGNVLLEKK